MPGIIVKTQAEWDALPKAFTEYTVVKIVTDGTFWLRMNSTPDSSSVEAWGSSRVEAWGNVSVRAQSEAAALALFAYAVAILVKKCKVAKKSKTCTVVTPKQAKGVEGWLESNGIEAKAKVTLYKRVSKDFETMEGTENETLWTVGTTLEHPAWEPKREECGAGKFHACSRAYFCDEFRDELDDRYVALEVAKKDLHAWDGGQYPHKIAVRKAKVLYECDKWGEKKGAKP